MPQAVIRYGIRRQLQDRIRMIQCTSLEEAYATKMKYVKALRTRPMAIETATANSQHYEVGTGVLQACLGPRMKYSCCLYPTGKETLGQAEIEMLEAYVERAQLKNGMKILDLGYDSECPKPFPFMADMTVKAADGVPVLFTLQKFSLTRRLQHSLIQGLKKPT